MKTLVAATLTLGITLASVATAQLDSFPTCAIQCLLIVLAIDGCSSVTNFECHCHKFEALLASVTPCIHNTCSADDQSKTIAAIQDTCASAGVPIP